MYWNSQTEWIYERLQKVLSRKSLNLFKMVKIWYEECAKDLQVCSWIVISWCKKCPINLSDIESQNDLTKALSTSTVKFG